LQKYRYLVVLLLLLALVPSCYPVKADTSLTYSIPQSVVITVYFPPLASSGIYDIIYPSTSSQLIAFNSSTYNGLQITLNNPASYTVTMNLAYDEPTVGTIQVMLGGTPIGSIDFSTNNETNFNLNLNVQQNSSYLTYNDAVALLSNMQTSMLSNLSSQLNTMQDNITTSLIFMQNNTAALLTINNNGTIINIPVFLYNLTQSINQTVVGMNQTVTATNQNVNSMNQLMTLNFGNINDSLNAMKLSIQALPAQITTLMAIMQNNLIGNMTIALSPVNGNLLAMNSTISSMYLNMNSSFNSLSSQNNALLSQSTASQTLLNNISNSLTSGMSNLLYLGIGGIAIAIIVAVMVFFIRGNYELPSLRRQEDYPPPIPPRTPPAESSRRVTPEKEKTREDEPPSQITHLLTSKKGLGEAVRKVKPKTGDNSIPTGTMPDGVPQ
jgi:hypothetical protein